jgi:glycerol uptake operon antiterminator
MLMGCKKMTKQELCDSLEISPIIAAVNERNLEKAIESPVDVIFLLGSSILNLKENIDAAHKANKRIFVHIDLTEGIGKDKVGVEFLARNGADGIISTKAMLIKAAKEHGLVTVQRFFALDSQGVESISDMLLNSSPDFIEIMPGVIGKIIERFSKEKTPLISGGLVETKQEVTTALSSGAVAISTGKADLWYM